MKKIVYPDIRDFDCEEDWQEAWEKHVMKIEAENDERREYDAGER